MQTLLWETKTQKCTWPSIATTRAWEHKLRYWAMKKTTHDQEWHQGWGAVQINKWFSGNNKCGRILTTPWEISQRHHLMVWIQQGSLKINSFNKCEPRYKHANHLNQTQSKYHLTRGRPDTYKAMRLFNCASAEGMDPLRELLEISLWKQQRVQNILKKKVSSAKLELLYVGNLVNK